MENKDWRLFLTTAVEVLGVGEYQASASRSWCSWTTFTRLASDAGYWTHGLPRLEDILETYTADGGVWGQPFPYSDLAHVIIPIEFYWESGAGESWKCGSRKQDIVSLSGTLHRVGVGHRCTDRVLEIKLY
jgi:hypothetical protein